MKLYNSLTNSLEEFKPIDENQITMYVCGPTVYNYIHIGNARPIIIFDVLRNYFKFLGYEVMYVSNYTDIDDKIINRAIEEGKTEKEISEFFIKAYEEDLRNLNIANTIISPKATEYMNEIIKFIKELVDKNYAYEVDGDVYFRVSKIDEYGKLSNQKVEDLLRGVRIDSNNKKEDQLDFTLWKKTDKGIKYDSPFGEGRPGWHTECVVMCSDIFNNKIDIHAGGSDLKFPHHENEIAQSRAINNHELANYWLHNGRLNINNEKMSKSIGNVIWLKDLLKEMTGSEFRMLILNSNYRQEINFTDELVEQSKKDYKKIKEAYLRGYYLYQVLDMDTDDNLYNQAEQHYTDCINEFTKQMESDLNTPNVLTLLHNNLKYLNNAIRNKERVKIDVSLNIFNDILNVLGIKIDGIKNMSEVDIEDYRTMNIARGDKNFELADLLRDKLTKKGILL